MGFIQKLFVGVFLFSLSGMALNPVKFHPVLPFQKSDFTIEELQHRLENWETIRAENLKWLNELKDLLKAEAERRREQAKLLEAKFSNNQFSILLRQTANLIEKGGPLFGFLIGFELNTPIFDFFDFRSPYKASLEAALTNLKGYKEAEAAATKADNEFVKGVILRDSEEYIKRASELWIRYPTVERGWDGIRNSSGLDTNYAAGDQLLLPNSEIAKKLTPLEAFSKVMRFEVSFRNSLLTVDEKIPHLDWMFISFIPMNQPPPKEKSDQEIWRIAFDLTSKVQVLGSSQRQSLLHADANFAQLAGILISERDFPLRIELKNRFSLWETPTFDPTTNTLKVYYKEKFIEGGPPSLFAAYFLDETKSTPDRTIVTQSSEIDCVSALMTHFKPKEL